MIIALMFMMSCTSYKEAVEGRWDLVQIKNERGDKICDIGKDEHCDVLSLTFETFGDELVVTGCDEESKELKAVYVIKEDGRLISKSTDKPNMYILDIKNNEIVLIDLLYDPIAKKNIERLLVFKKTI